MDNVIRLTFSKTVRMVGVNFTFVEPERFRRVPCDLRLTPPSDDPSATHRPVTVLGFQTVEEDFKISPAFPPGHLF